MTTVRYAVLPPDRIFNSTSPRSLHPIVEGWRGNEPFWHPKYEPVWGIMERIYVEGFNAATGHYDRLTESLLSEGFRNPIIVSAGDLERKKEEHLPPHWRRPDKIVSERVGGSRLWVAQRYGLDVSCIVNDRSDVLPEAEVLADLDAVRAKFTDWPAKVKLNGDGLWMSDLPFTHIPESERYSMREQSQIRRKLIGRIRGEVRRWLREHD